MNWSEQSEAASVAPGGIPLGSSAMSLSALCNGLQALNARVAEEFLALASVLQSNASRARQISTESHKATSSDASLQNTRSIALLQRILRESSGIGDMVEISAGQMLDILSRIKTCRSPLNELAKLRCMLQTVGLLSKIEGGRIKNTQVDLSGFSTDIDGLANDVHTHVERILEDSEVLSNALQDGVRQLRRFQQQESLPLADLVRRAGTVLDPMIAQSNALQAAAHEIDEQYISFRGSTDKVVMSLQSEDIARQRIEHVQEALHRVATLLSSGEKVESCAGVLAMQRSQLLSTRELLANSVQAIHQGLEALGPRIQELVSRTATLAQQTGEDGQSFASVIDAELGNVSNVFQHCSSSVNAVVTIVKNVMPSVEKMTEGACALENIEASIRLVSLNAAIKAAHLEQEGLGMGVIASELQTINLKSEADTNLVLENLAAIKEALARINREETVSEGSLMMGDNNVVTSQLAGLSSSVRTVSQQVTAGLDEVKRLAEVLCSEVKLGCDQARRAEVITQLFDDQVRAFDEAVSQFGYMSEMASTSADRGHGGDISTLYSMESERKLHQEIFGKDAAMVEETPAPSPSGSEFGDDIELF